MLKLEKHESNKAGVLLRYDITEENLNNYKLAQGIIASLQAMADNGLTNIGFYAEDCSGQTLDMFIVFEVVGSMAKNIDDAVEQAVEFANVFAD